VSSNPGNTTYILLRSNGMLSPLSSQALAYNQKDGGDWTVGLIKLDL